MDASEFLSIIIGGSPMTKNFDLISARAKKMKWKDSSKPDEVPCTIKNMSPLSKLVFIIPKTNNEGKLFNWKLFYWLVRSLLKLAGGFNTESVSGGWLTPEGLIQYEDCYKFTVGIAEIKIDDLLQLLMQAKHVFQQESLYFELEGKIILL